MRNSDQNGFEVLDILAILSFALQWDQMQDRRVLAQIQETQDKILEKLTALTVD